MNKMHALPQEDILCKEGQTRAFLRPYTKNWDNPESNSLHLEYSYNGKNWYSLNGNNGVWFPDYGSKQLTDPSVYQMKSGSYFITARDAKDPSHMYFAETNDFYSFTDNGYLYFDNPETVTSTATRWNAAALFNKDGSNFKIVAGQQYHIVYAYRAEGSSGGGQDIIGLCCTKKYPGFSVGRVNIMMNVLVYAICLFMFNIEIVIYSLIYTTILSIAIDRVHVQNINMSVMIFTKKTGISRAIMEQLGRGVTNWDGEGAYTNKTSYILFVMISKYEMGQIKQIVHSIDPHAFMIFTEGCAVDGNFEKRL